MRSRLGLRNIPRTVPDELDFVQDAVRLVARQIVVPPSSSSPQVLVTSTSITTLAPLTTVLFSSTTLPIAPTSQSSIVALNDNQQLAATASASPTGSSYIGEQNPMSETSTEIIIIVAAAGITVALFLIGFFYWRKKKNNKRKDLLDKSSERPPSVSAPLGSNWGTYNWDPKSTYAPQATYKEVIEVSDATYARPGTSPSTRAMPSRAPFSPPNMRSTLSQSSDPAPSYAPPAIKQPPIPPQPSIESRALSPDLPLQRPETRPSSLARGMSTTNPPKRASRFSRWTNSQLFKTPKTPVTPAPPITGVPLANPMGDPNRYSTISAAESVATVARYRTVESWVGQQAGRYEEARIQERIQFQLDEAIGELHRAASTKRMTKLKTIPLQDSSSVFVDGVNDDNEVADQVTELSLAPKASVKRTKSAKHRTNESDLTVFRAHPGTKVDIPESARIPSAILDGKFAMGGGYGYRR